MSTGIEQSVSKNTVNHNSGGQSKNEVVKVPNSPENLIDQNTLKLSTSETTQETHIGEDEANKLNDLNKREQVYSVRALAKLLKIPAERFKDMVSPSRLWATETNPPEVYADIYTRSNDPFFLKDFKNKLLKAGIGVVPPTEIEFSPGSYGPSTAPERDSLLGLTLKVTDPETVRWVTKVAIKAEKLRKKKWDGVFENKIEKMNSDESPTSK